jgi:transposase InsO family protein
LTCDGLDYVIFQIQGQNVSFLIDTGATLSLIHIDKIPNNVRLLENNTVITGVGGNITCKNIAYLSLENCNERSFTHKFHVLHDMPCHADGIIGLDFMRTYGANIDLHANLLTLHFNNQACVVQIHRNGDNATHLSLPARTESLHLIKVNTLLPTHRNEYVVSAMELRENVFLAGSIGTVKNNRIPVKILNTSDKDIQLPVFTPELTSITDYDVSYFRKHENGVTRATRLLDTLKLTHLSPTERKLIESICVKYADVFYLDGDKLGTTNILSQSITVKPNTKPVYVKPYRLPTAMKPEISRQIKNMLDEDIIEPASSDWNSPILLVPKKSDNNTKKWRLVIDYRKVNNVIQDDKFPLPNIVEILDSLSGAIYFSHLDLQQSYYQTALDEDSRNITSFSTSQGQFRMKRLPMGLKLSASAFSRVMSIAMSGLSYEKCFIYMDDLVVFGRNIDQHNKNLTDVLQRLRKVNLKVNPQKCEFLKTQLLYLGHIVSAQGVLPDPEKTRVLKDYPAPTTIDEVRRFVAFCNYYRKFIPGFATITLPLNKLCRKNVTFNWTDECKQAFMSLKEKLISPPILQYPDFSDSNEFVLQTDASGKAIGSVLCNKDLRPIAYASRTLNKAELNYPTIHKELLAVTWSVKHYRPYLFGKYFTIMTDHKPLLYLFSMKDPSSRLIKFRLQLEEYDYKVVYIRGKDNVGADALSRVTITSDELKNIEKRVLVMTRAQSKRALQQNTGSGNATDLNIPIDARPDQPQISEILRKPNNSVELDFISNSDLDNLRTKNKITMEHECFSYIKEKSIIYINLSYMSHYTRADFANKLSVFCKKINIEEVCIIKTLNNALFLKNLSEEIMSNKEWSGPRINILSNVKRIMDRKEKTIILNDYHLLPTCGHAGIRRMINNIKRKYYWPELEQEVRNFVRKCSKCQHMKYSRENREPMQITSTATAALEKIFLDVVGPLETDVDGFTYILTIQCELSKYIEAYPLRNKDTVSVARALVNNFILRYGIPKVIATDRGTEFTSSTFKEVCKLLKIEKLQSTAYHHQSLGAIENMHKHLGAFLRIYCDEHADTWSHWLPFWCFAYNTTIHSSTKYSPFELVFGKECRIPSNLSDTLDPLYNPNNYMLELRYRLQLAHKEAREHLLKSKLANKSLYDRNVLPFVYKKDDLVLIKNETGKKLSKLYNGPFKVVEDQGPNVIILNKGKNETIHKNRVKLFIE